MQLRCWRRQNSGMSILVIGSLNADLTLHLSRAPLAGETVTARDVVFACGGKGGNTACALGRLGMKTRFFGAVGKDSHGDRLLENLLHNGVDTDYVLRSDAPTGTAYILLEDNAQNRIILVPGANGTLTPECIRKKAMPLLRKAEMVAAQLEIPKPCIQAIIQLCKQLGKRLIVDAGPADGYTMVDFADCWCVSPNETELETLAGRPLPGEEEQLRAARQLHGLGVAHVPVKLGDKGCLYVGEAGEFRLPAYRVKAVDTTAAGDSFTAGWCSALVRGMGVKEALTYANRCGAIAVTRMGAGPSLPTSSEVETFMADFR